MFSFILIFFRFIVFIALGDIMLFNSLIIINQSTCILNIFKPPVVDPEHPPISIMANSNVLEKEPQFEKFSVEKPVPVIIDTLLNKDNLNAKNILMLLSIWSHIAIAITKNTIREKKSWTWLSRKMEKFFLKQEIYKVKGRLANIIPITIIISVNKLLK